MAYKFVRYLYLIHLRIYRQSITTQFSDHAHTKEDIKMTGVSPCERFDHIRKANRRCRLLYPVAFSQYDNLRSKLLSLIKNYWSFHCLPTTLSTVNQLLQCFNHNAISIPQIWGVESTVIWTFWLLFLTSRILREKY